MSFVHDIVDLVTENNSGLLSRHQSWERIRLGDIAQIINGAPFKSIYFGGKEGKPVLRIRDILQGHCSSRYSGPIQDEPTVVAGDIVVGMDGDFNSTVWQGEKALLNQRVCKIVPNKYLFDKGFLALLLPGYLQLINDHTSAVTVKHLSSRTLSEVPLPLPPRSEQARIRERIEGLFSELGKGEESLRQAEKLLERYRQSVLKAAVTGELTREWREQHKDELEPGDQLLQRILKARRKAWEDAELAKMRSKGQEPKDDGWKKKYKEPQAPDTTDLPELPEGWVWATLDQLASLVTSGSRGWSKYYSERGAIFIRAQDINKDRLSLERTAHVSLPKGSEGARTLISNKDILITITGANVTKSALVEEDVGEAYVSQHVGLVRPVMREISVYLYCWIICPAHGRKYLEEAAYGAGKPGLSLINIREMLVPLPPLAEQHHIMEKLLKTITNCEEIKRSLSGTYLRCQSIRQSILKAAFSGKLVSRDPKDEPASELLKRIAAEKEAAQGKQPRTRRGSTKQTKPKSKASASRCTAGSGPGAALRSARKLAGLTQAALAEAAGLNQVYISQMENNRRDISPEQAAKLAQALGIKPDELAASK